jgi:hypothetical protein
MGAPDSPVAHWTVTVHCLVRTTSAQPLGFGAVDRWRRLSSCCTGQSGALWLLCSDFCRDTIQHCSFAQSIIGARGDVAPLAHRTVRWIIAKRASEFPRVACLKLYGPGAPNTVRCAKFEHTQVLLQFFIESLTDFLSWFVLILMHLI